MYMYIRYISCTAPELYSIIPNYNKRSIGALIGMLWPRCFFINSTTEVSLNINAPNTIKIRELTYWE